MLTMRVFNCLSGGILCGLTLLLIFLPCFTPEWAGNLIFISLSAIPICIADGIIFAILLWKHNRWWMLYLLLLLGSSPILSGYFPLHFLHREEVPDSNQLKLVCWNAEGFRLNKDTLAKAIHSIRILQPGIVCLQERPHTNLLAWDTIRAAFPDYPIASSTRGRMKFLIWPSSAAGLSETFKSTTSRTATIRCFKRISG